MGKISRATMSLRVRKDAHVLLYKQSVFCTCHGTPRCHPTCAVVFALSVVWALSGVGPSKVHASSEDRAGPGKHRTLPLLAPLLAEMTHAQRNTTSRIRHIFNTRYYFYELYIILFSSYVVVVSFSLIRSACSSDLHTVPHHRREMENAGLNWNCFVRETAMSILLNAFRTISAPTAPRSYTQQHVRRLVRPESLVPVEDEVAKM